MIGSVALLEQFEAPARLRALGGAYLASNTMGIIPASAIDAELECLRLQARHGIEVWDNGAWMGVLERYAAVIARYLEVSPTQVCPVTNITDGLWRVFGCLEYRGDRRTILQTAMEFTTQEYAAFGFERFGAEVVIVPSDPAHHTVPTDRLLDAIRHHRPVVVNLSHAAFESGYLHDVQAVAAACREVDSVFCLDAAQTGFVLPIHLQQTGADVVLLQQHKWGCGGTGAACVVAHPRFLERYEPALVGWMSHAETFAFERGRARFGQSAWRLLGGTPDVPAKARAAAAAGLIVDTLGIDRVFEHNQALVGALLEGLTEKGLRPIALPRRAGFVAIECGSADRARALEHGLRARHLVIDSRGSRLRVGPTFYNDRGDIERLVAALGELNRSV